MATAPITLYTVCIGQRTWKVTSLAEASATFCAARDAAEQRGGGGASRMPKVTVLGDGGPYHISYNGRVWHGTEWTLGAVPAYDPREVQS